MKSCSCWSLQETHRKGKQVTEHMYYCHGCQRVHDDRLFSFDIITVLVYISNEKTVLSEQSRQLRTCKLYSAGDVVSWVKARLL